jgi:hypothetical protein
MPRKYVLPTISGDHKDEKPTKVLTAMITKLEKLQENRLEVQNNFGENQWNKIIWSQHKHIENKFQFGDYVM